MNANFTRSYRSKKGNTVFVYEVTGKVAEIEAYKVSQGDQYRESDTTGKPLWFTTRFAGKSVNLITTASGNTIADMSAFEQAASLSAQFGGNFGQELAKTAAAQLLGAQSSAVQAAVNTPAPAAEVEIPVDNEDLD